jgi:hypothetical protein
VALRSRLLAECALIAETSGSKLGLEIGAVKHGRGGSRKRGVTELRSNERGDHRGQWVGRCGGLTRLFARPRAVSALLLRLVPSRGAAAPTRNIRRTRPGPIAGRGSMRDVGRSPFDGPTDAIPEGLDDAEETHRHQGNDQSVLCEPLPFFASSGPGNALWHGRSLGCSMTWSVGGGLRHRAEFMPNILAPAQAQVG